MLVLASEYLLHSNSRTASVFSEKIDREEYSDVPDIVQFVSARTTIRSVCYPYPTHLPLNTRLARKEYITQILHGVERLNLTEGQRLSWILLSAVTTSVAIFHAIATPNPTCSPTVAYIPFAVSARTSKSWVPPTERTVCSVFPEDRAGHNFEGILDQGG